MQWTAGLIEMMRARLRPRGSRRGAFHEVQTWTRHPRACQGGWMMRTCSHGVELPAGRPQDAPQPAAMQPAKFGLQASEPCVQVLGLALHACMQQVQAPPRALLTGAIQVTW
jgi:hypothetical protein